MSRYTIYPLKDFATAQPLVITLGPTWVQQNRIFLARLQHGRVRNFVYIHGFSNKYIIDIGLGELQKILDAQGIEIVDNQREGVVGRKGLADKTKGLCYTSTIYLPR